MDQLSESTILLDQFHVPAFTVEAGVISRTNYAAQQHMLTQNTPIQALLGANAEIYHTFSEGCLYLPLQICGIPMDFCVSRSGKTDLFVADPDAPSDLQPLVLASRELRAPLANLTAMVEAMQEKHDPAAAAFNRELHRMCRLVCNMSDAAVDPCSAKQNYLNISSVLTEAFDKSAALLAEAGITVHYQGISKPIHGYADSQMLQRAVYNLMSNSAKFTPEGGQIHARLSQHDDRLHLTVWDTGKGIDPQVLSTAFTRYRRACVIEDSRHGLGLGMLLVRNAARAHGGTVLIEPIPDGGSRITVTLAVRSSCAEPLGTPLLIPDYTGGRDQALQELSDVLPAHLYK